VIREYIRTSSGGVIFSTVSTRMLFPAPLWLIVTQLNGLDIFRDTPTK
jgi:hypothetical protein